MTDDEPITAATVRHTVRQWSAVVLVIWSCIVAVVSGVATASFRLAEYSGREADTAARITALSLEIDHLTTRLDEIRDRMAQADFRQQTNSAALTETALHLHALDARADSLRSDLATLHEDAATEHERVMFLLGRPQPAGKPR